MRKLLTILFFTIGASLIAEVTMPFNFTIIPTLNMIPGDHNTVLATGFISSDVYGIKGIQLGPVFATTKEDMYGFQASGVFNVVGGNTLGFQNAGVFNVAQKNMLGIQAAGVFNVVDGRMDGVQMAGVFNTVEGESVGLQLAGVYNIAEGRALASQIGGVFNISEDIKGAQIAGVFNIAKDIDGSQVGVVNVANKVDGVQLGVVNINTGGGRALPIGVINIYKNGVKDIFAYTDGSSNIIYGIETGSKHFYTQLFTGTSWENMNNSYDRFVGYGFGVRNRYFDLVLGAKNHVNAYDAEYHDYPTPTGRASISLGLGSVSIVGGVEGNLAIDTYNDDSHFFAESENFVAINDGLDLHYNWFAGVKVHL